MLAASLIAASGALIGGQRGQAPPGSVPVPVPAPAGPGPAGPVPTAMLAGQVVEQGTERAIPGATLLLLRSAGSPGPVPAARGQMAPSVIAADSQGRFFFSPLPAGTFGLQVSKNGYMNSAAGFSRGIELAEGERITDLKIRLVKLATLAGTIRDEAGDPVVGTDVLAFRRTLVNGRRTLGRPVTARSDDRGTYRIPGLTPGEYIVCACRRDPIPFDGVLLTTLAADPLNLMGIAARALRVGADAATLDSTLRTFAPTFHPNSSTVARATRLTLASGEEKMAVDVEVNAVRATRVSGTIVGAVGAINASSLRLVPAGEVDEATALAVWTPALVQPGGRFDFAGIPPGQYELRVAHAPTDPAIGGAPSGAALQFIGARASALGQPAGRGLAEEPPQWAIAPVSVGDDGAAGLSIALRSAAILTGRLQLVGTAPQPSSDQLSRLAPVFVQPAATELFARSFGGVGRLAADATFRIPGLVPGRYVLTMSGVPGYPTVTSVVVGGIDITDLPLEVHSADISDVVFTLTDTPMATLSGTVAGAGSATALDTTILIFPADRRYWSEPGAGRRRFRVAPVSRKGAFTIALLPAGEYFVVAVSDHEANEWQESSRLEALSRVAQRVQLRDGDKQTLEIRR